MYWLNFLNDKTVFCSVCSGKYGNGKQDYNLNTFMREYSIDPISMSIRLDEKEQNQLWCGYETVWYNVTRWT